MDATGVPLLACHRQGLDMVKNAGFSATDGEKIRAAGLHQPAAVSGLANKDTGLAPLAERMRSDGINNPRRVAAKRARPATDGEKIRAAGLHQPAAVSGLANKDTGLATLAERMRADGLS